MIQMDFTGFIGNLKTHEMEMKVRERREPTKKKSIAFKATPSIVKDEESTDEDEEDFAMLIQRVGKMFYKKGRKSNFRRTRPQGKFERKKEEMDPCYHCKKMEYLIADCPSLQATTSKKLHKKKKAMMATWDDSEIDSNEEEIDTANVCFTANEKESNKVTSGPTLDDDKLTMNELAIFFEELQ